MFFSLISQPNQAAVGLEFCSYTGAGASTGGNSPSGSGRTKGVPIRSLCHSPTKALGCGRGEEPGVKVRKAKRSTLGKPRELVQKRNIVDSAVMNAQRTFAG